MAKSQPVKPRFAVRRRFSVWLSREVSADTFESALTAARDMNSITDWMTFDSDVEHMDSETLPGLGVEEVF